MVKPTPKPEVKAVGYATDMFSAEELKKLEEEALQEHDEELKIASAETFKDEIKRKARQAAFFKAGKDTKGKEVETVQSNLAPHSPFVNLDGQLFYHGLTYRFTQAQAQSIKSAMYETWRHEGEIGRANVNADRSYRPVNTTLSGAI